MTSLPRLSYNCVPYARGLQRIYLWIMSARVSCGGIHSSSVKGQLLPCQPRTETWFVALVSSATRSKGQWLKNLMPIFILIPLHPPGGFYLEGGLAVV